MVLHPTNRFWLGLLLTWLAVGCIDRGFFGGGDPSPPSDDDDTASGDDDSAADDDDMFPAPPDWEHSGITFWAQGGAAGGPAEVYLHLAFSDDSGDLMCEMTYTYEATYTYGTGQGDDYYDSADERLVWGSGSLGEHTCSPEYEVDPDVLRDSLEWEVHPLTFVSCSRVGDDPDLAATVVGEDYLWHTSVASDFEHFCAMIGPAASWYFASGLVEGVWLKPSSVDALDAIGPYTYFVPGSTAHAPSWVFFGFAAAAEFNHQEPIEGLEGRYSIVPAFPEELFGMPR